LEAIRFVIAWECLCGPDSVTLQGDVPGAYLTARLSGPRTFLRVPRFLWLPKWPDPSKYVDPLFELAVALYGLQRGDTCWGGRSQRGMKTMKYRQIIDSGEQSMWCKDFSHDVLDTVVVGIYSDNYNIAGRAVLCIRCHQELMEYFGFSQEANFALTDAIGLEREKVMLRTGEPAVFLHQTQYLCHVVDKYIRDHNGGKALKKYTTPLPIEDYKVEESVPDHIPRLTKTDAASIGGEVNWAARGSRYDLTLFGKRIVQRITMWDRRDDAMVFRGMGYMDGTRTLGLVMHAAAKDVHSLITYGDYDSDHGNDSYSAKSTSSHWGALTGPNTTLPISWGCKGQTAVGRNTAEVESIACDQATFVHLLPLTSTVEQVMQRGVRLVVRGDNEASIAASKKGFSRKLGYLRKYQRTSLSALRCVYIGLEEHECEDRDQWLEERSVNMLGKVSSDNNRADLGNKPMDHQRHWFLVEACSMSTLEQVRIDTSTWAKL
jgi:hypothetical protein